MVNKVRYALRGFTGAKKIKVGHAGTLDPLATGVLVVCCGRATKTIDTLQAQAKVYTATIRLGAHTPSLDAETEVDRWAEDPAQVTGLTLDDVKAGTETLTGTLEQRPPLFSAKKVGGVKAYNAATESQAGTVVPTEITIYEDRTFDFILKTPPTPVLIRQKAGIAKAASNPGTETAATISDADVEEIAKIKMPDLNANDLEAAKQQVRGTARSMGISTS